MGKHIEFDSKASIEKIKTAGVNKNTQKAQRLAEQHFLDFVKEKLGDKHEDIFTEASIMEDILIQYFDTYRLNDGQLPSKSTLDMMKSHVKGFIKRITKNKFDINCSATFPKFSRLWKAKILELKQNGRGDVRHNQPIPQPVREKIYRLLALLTKLMEKDETDPSYQSLVDQLPSSYRENYHKLVLHGAMFTFLLNVSSFIHFFHCYGR